MSEQVYGIHAVTECLKQRPHTVQVLRVLDQRNDARIQALVELAESQGVALEKVSKQELDEAAEGRHQGALAMVSAAREWHEQDLPGLIEQSSNPPLVLILDGVTDPHNLGACLRSADAAGVTAVIAPKDNAAKLNATVRKVACGAAENVPFIAVTNLVRTMKLLQDAGLWMTGAAGEAETSLYEQDFRGPVGIVMGAEGDGLRRLTRESCDFLARLPMAGSVSSLNVSVATGIFLYEVVRQRIS